jgi:hypothetical protein
MHLTMIIMVAAAAGCAGDNRDGKAAQGYSDEAPPALPVPAAPRPEIDYMSTLGVARARADGRLCVAMPAALRDGEELVLVSVPIAPPKADSTPAEYSSVLVSRVTGRGENECSIEKMGHGLRLPGDSLYTVALARDSALSAAVLFAVALPFRTFFRAGHTAAARLSDEGHVLNFRVCTSGEGLHLTAWDGKPLTGKRVWHRYYYLGYDTDPSCVPGDTGEGE